MDENIRINGGNKMNENKNNNLSFSEIKELINLVADKNLGKFEVKYDNYKISIEGKKEKVIQPAGMNNSSQCSQPALAAASAVSEEGTAAAVAVTTKSEPCGNIVKAPIIGTFYEAPAPDKEPFVKVGQKVKKGDVIMIIESMKLMNEIQSEFDGVVTEVLVENGTAVEFDQAIMIIN